MTSYTILIMSINIVTSGQGTPAGRPGLAPRPLAGARIPQTRATGGRDPDGRWAELGDSIRSGGRGHERGADGAGPCGPRSSRPTGTGAMRSSTRRGRLLLNVSADRYWIDSSRSRIRALRGDFVRVGNEQEPLWLVAPKATEALYLAPHRVAPGLRVHAVARSSSGEFGDSALRSAALSATFILVNAAAIELDVDPEEFDVLEPRVYEDPDRGQIPILHGSCADFGPFSGH